MPQRIAFVLALILPMTACTQFPQLEGSVSDSARNADYPDLVPVENLMANKPANRIPPETEAQLSARVAGLRARAARLRRTVIDGSTRARMAQGVE